MDKQTKEARVYEIFQRISPGYDQANRRISLGMDRSWKRLLTDALVRALPREGTLLDVCCGTGDIALDVARRRPDVMVTGLDGAPAMLSVAERRRGGLENVRLTTGNALALPWPDNSFDAAAVSFGLRNTADYALALSEMRRVVRPGGLVCCMDSFVPESAMVKPFYRLYFGHVMPVLGGGVKNRREYRWLYESTEAFLSCGALAALFRETGLAAVETQKRMLGACALVRGRKIQERQSD